MTILAIETALQEQRCNVRYRYFLRVWRIEGSLVEIATEHLRAFTLLRSFDVAVLARDTRLLLGTD